MICVNQRWAPSSVSCAQRGSSELAERLEQNIALENLEVKVLRLPCLGRCDHGPAMRLAPGGEFLLGMDEENIMEKVRAFCRVTDAADQNST